MLQLNEDTQVVITAAAQSVGALMSLVAEASQFPGAEVIPELVKKIYEKVQKAKELKKELAEVSNRCVELLGAFNDHARHMKSRDMKMVLPVGATQEVLEVALAIVERYKSLGYWKRFFMQSKIDEEVTACNKKIDRAIQDLQTRNGFQVIEQGAYIIDKLSSINDTTRELLRNARQSPERLQGMSPEEGAANANKTQQMIVDMDADKDGPDANLQFAGVKVSRAQFNVIYSDLVNYLENLERYTGKRPENTNLGKRVSLLSKDPVAGTLYTNLYQGKYQGKTVAVKSLRALSTDEPTLERGRKRFLQEFGVWSTLWHSHIQPFLGWTDACTDFGYVALVSPWRNNGDIMRYCRTHPNANKYHLLAGAAAGLQFLHVVKNIVHGSIRGSNILITDEGEAVLADFSVAAVCADINTDMSALSHTRTPCLQWQAIEVVVNNSRPTLKSDIWSMAMTMLHLFTMRKTGPLEGEIKADHQMHSFFARNKRPKRPEGNSWISDSLWEFMQQCWQTEPELRPDVSQVLQALQRAEAAYVPLEGNSA